MVERLQCPHDLDVYTRKCSIALPLNRPIVRLQPRNSPENIVKDGIECAVKHFENSLGFPPHNFLGNRRRVYSAECSLEEIVTFWGEIEGNGREDRFGVNEGRERKAGRIVGE
jgi:hypothetical protein